MSRLRAPDVTIRSAEDADWPAMVLLGATCFGAFRDPHYDAMCRSMMPADAALVACDGSRIVGMAMYLDLRLTVPGGAALPAAGVTWVAVSPTHRRRGILRAMLDELHERIDLGGYPVAGLLARDGGLYGRFGYGPAAIEQRLRVQRGGAGLHADAPDPGGVTIIAPAQHRDELALVYQRWCERTPGGLRTPPVMWEQLLADRESARCGDSPLFGLLHPDGFVLYRVRESAAGESVEVVQLVAVTTGAHAALWRVLLGLDLMDSINLGTHPADPLPYLLVDARQMEITGSRDSLWLRINDVPAALQARTYPADLAAVMRIADTRSGEQTLALTIRDGRALVAETDDAPDVHLDLSVLGSIYLGAHRPSAFAAANRLRCNDIELLGQLDRAFDSPIPAQLGYGF